MKLRRQEKVVSAHPTRKDRGDSERYGCGEFRSQAAPPFTEIGWPSMIATNEGLPEFRNPAVLSVTVCSGDFERNGLLSAVMVSVQVFGCLVHLHPHAVRNFRGQQKACAIDSFVGF